jgi:hypothetical protein
MAVQFSNSSKLFADLPPEIRFVDAAMSIPTGTEVRRYASEVFCREEGVEPAALREGVRRLVVQLENMQPDPYGKLTRIVSDLSSALAVGTPDEREIYDDYLYSADPAGPAAFQTYQFEKTDLDMLRFLENEVDVKEGGVGPIDEVMRQFGLGKAVDAMSTKKDGRPMELGWLDLLPEPAMRVREEDQEEEGDGAVVEFEEDPGDEGLVLPVVNAADE